MNLPRYIDAVDHAVIELGETGTPVAELKDHHNISHTEVLARLNTPWPT